MRFDLPADTRRRVDEARGFAEAVLRPRGRRSSLDREGWETAAQFGLFRALPQPGRSGTCGKGAVETAALFEAMGRGGADRGLLFAMGAHLFGCVAPLVTCGTPRQLEQWEEPLRNGDAVGALAVTEAAGNATLDNIATTATPTADGCRLDGAKTLVTNAPDADVFIVLAREGGRRDALGLTAFLVPAKTPGLRVTGLPSPALPGAPMGEIAFEACSAPHGAVLGRPGGGLRVFSVAMQWERSCLLAGLLGAARRDLALCRDFLAGRRDAGGALLRHQALSHRLARMSLSLESARLMLYRAAWLLDEGHDDLAAAAMAKIAAGEAITAAAEDVFRLLAGSGWRGDGLDTLAALGDAHGALLASGTSEMLLELLARRLQSAGEAA